MSSITPDSLKDRIIAALRTVHDPEIPVNIYDLGLIYGVDIDEAGAVLIRMTLTSPNCPVADKLPAEAQAKARSVEGVTSAKVELTFDPPWSTELMTEEAKIELESMGIDPDRAKDTIGSRFAPLTIGRKPGDKEKRGR